MPLALLHLPLPSEGEGRGREAEGLCRRTLGQRCPRLPAVPGPRGLVCEGTVFPVGLGFPAPWAAGRVPQGTVESSGWGEPGEEVSGPRCRFREVPAVGWRAVEFRVQKWFLLTVTVTICGPGMAPVWVRGLWEDVSLGPRTAGTGYRVRVVSPT